MSTISAKINENEIRPNSEVLTASIDLAGKRVVDIGCGDGSLVRLMARHGAKSFGVDNNPAQLEKARLEKTLGGEIFHQGIAEKLPFDDACMDVTVFFNSLHHIAGEQMQTALSEAHRVLKPGGLLYVSEPLAHGPHFDLMAPVHDETEVRANAKSALDKAPSLGFEKIDEIFHTHIVSLADFAAFRERMIRINPDRVDEFAKLESKLKGLFDSLGVRTEKSVEFAQPMRVEIFKKT
ncbi:MAG: class I SAM-dependent methyltransferase [Rhodospirillaceae bacterium]|nr:class I SAM-dependent methyltransferase [Rhodospirillaceae bacterium]